VLFAEGDVYSDEMHRAVAARHWQAGADGIYVWNQDWVRFVRDGRFDPRWWREVGDSAVLSGLNKHYTVGPAGRGGNLPLEASRAGDGAVTEIDIADDPSTQASGPRSILRVLVEHLTSLDRVRFDLNGRRLDVSSATKRFNYSDCWLDFEADGAWRRGWNRLSLVVEARNPHVEAPLVLRCVEILVHYGARESVRPGGEPA
jgi:hypothetical protein